MAIFNTWITEFAHHWLESSHIKPLHSLQLLVTLLQPTAVITGLGLSSVGQPHTPISYHLPGFGHNWSVVLWELQKPSLSGQLRASLKDHPALELSRRPAPICLALRPLLQLGNCLGHLTPGTPDLESVSLRTFTLDHAVCSISIGPQWRKREISERSHFCSQLIGQTVT